MDPRAKAASPRVFSFGNLDYAQSCFGWRRRSLLRVRR